MFNKMKIAFAGSIAAAAMVAAPAHAATETVGADAEIIEAVSLANVVDIDFGTIAADATGGTVSVAATAAGTRACGTLTCVGTASSGSVDVTAASGQTVDVTMPTGTVTLSDGTNNMTMTPSVSSASFTSTGTDTIYFGGSLTVAANQAAGAYSGSFNVDVDYQ